MPNTLAHLGVQGVLTRTLVRGADPKWIFLGCLIPDLPWILQRGLRILAPGVDAYDLRLYVVVQSSLFCCLLLSGALAALSGRPGRTFVILGLNSLFHLLLDACQIKWANGVHLLAPFHWQMWGFAWFWPESGSTYLLTGFGLVYVVFIWRQGMATPVSLNLRPARWAVFIPLLAAYLLVPWLLLSGPKQADNHYVQTLSHPDRAGRYVEFDRNDYSPAGDGTGRLHTFSGEELTLKGDLPDEAATLSLQGRFLSENTIAVQDYHVHSRTFRDGASYLGLLVIPLLWGMSIFRQGRQQFDQS